VAGTGAGSCTLSTQPLEAACRGCDVRRCPADDQRRSGLEPFYDHKTSHRVWRAVIAPTWATRRRRGSRARLPREPDAAAASFGRLPLAVTASGTRLPLAVTA
jgi:hypothetical protein